MRDVSSVSLLWFLRYPHNELLFAVTKMYPFSPTLQTSGRDISKTVTNTAMEFSAILIYIKVIVWKEFYFFRNVPLSDQCEFQRPETRIAGASGS